MLTYQKLVDTYIRNANDDSMRGLARETGLFVEEVRELKPELVDDFLTKIDLILNPHFTRESAEYAVSLMKNKDNSTGEHWSYDTTTKVLDGKGYKFHPADWYWTLNMVYSDFYKNNRSTDEYVELAYDFLNDIDWPNSDCKAKSYWRIKQLKTY